MSKVWDRVDIYERLRFSNDADDAFCRWDLDPVPVSDVSVFLPSLTADDVFMFADFPAVLTNKTINGGSVRLTRFGTSTDDVVAYEPSTYPAVTLGAPSVGQLLVVDAVAPQISLTWGTITTLPAYIDDFYDAGPYVLSGADSDTPVSFGGWSVVDGATYRVAFSLEHQALASTAQYDIDVNLVTSAPSSTTLHSMNYQPLTNCVPTFYPVSGFSYHVMDDALTYTVDIFHNHVGLLSEGTIRRISIEIWRVS